MIKIVDHAIFNYYTDANSSQEDLVELAGWYDNVYDHLLREWISKVDTSLSNGVGVDNTSAVCLFDEYATYSQNDL